MATTPCNPSTHRHIPQKQLQEPGVQVFGHRASSPISGCPTPITLPNLASPLLLPRVESCPQVCVKLAQYSLFTSVEH